MNNKPGKLKISFCTVCMNRLHHLVETLPKNIEDNQDYGNVEFVVVDYNSQDGMEEWIRENMFPYIESGLVLYIKAPDMPFFHMSHSKNVAAKCATGDVICNVDADNFIGKGFATYLNDVFSTEANVVLAPDRMQSGRDLMGRICLRKEDYLKIGGYNEEMLHYSYEDDFFLTKAKKLGLQLKYIRNDVFLGAIAHSNYDRLKFSAIFTRLEHLYFRHVSSSESQIMMLYKDKKFERGTITLHLVPYEKFSFPVVYDFSERAKLRSDTWQKGSWSVSGNELALSDAENNYQYRLENNGLQISSKEETATFSKVSDQNFLLTLVYTWSTAINLSIMHQDADTVTEFGKATVYKNFSSEPYTL